MPNQQSLFSLMSEEGRSAYARLLDRPENSAGGGDVGANIRWPSPLAATEDHRIVAQEMARILGSSDYDWAYIGKYGDVNKAEQFKAQDAASFQAWVDDYNARADRLAGLPAGSDPSDPQVRATLADTYNGVWPGVGFPIPDASSPSTGTERDFSGRVLDYQEFANGPTQDRTYDLASGSQPSVLVENRDATGTLTSATVTGTAWTLNASNATISLADGAAATITGDNNTLNLDTGASASITGTNETVNGSNATINLAAGSSATFISGDAGDSIVASHATIIGEDNVSGTLFGSSNSFSYGANSAFNLVGDTNSVTLGPHSDLWVMSGDQNDAVSGNNDTIGTQDHVVFNLTGSGDTVALGANSSLALMSGSGSDTVYADNDQIGTQSNVSFNLSGSNATKRAQTNRVTETSTIVVKCERSVSAAIILACVAMAPHARLNCMHAR